MAVASDLTIDIRTKVIPHGARIWALFPELGRRYLSTFLEQSVVFLGLPGLMLSQGVLNDRGALRRHVAMSEAIARWYIGRSGGSFPSRNPNTYAPQPRQFTSTISHVWRFFSEIQIGDLICVPEGGQYAPVHFGEIQTAFNSALTISVPRYPREAIAVRKVRWYTSLQERRHFSATLSHLWSNRKALIEINSIAFGSEVYAAAYGDYVLVDDTRRKSPKRVFRRSRLCDSAVCARG